MARLIAGVDEVGRGPWAGPVVACALVLHRQVHGLADSKVLRAERRTELAAVLASPHVATAAIGVASVNEIDRLNIRVATFLAMRRAVERLPLRPDQLLIDGREAPDLGGIEAAAVIGGDGKVNAIAAASIVAKTWRDALMLRLAVRYPAYGWSTNAGYGTAAHRRALLAFGVTGHHRRSFGPVRAALG